MDHWKRKLLEFGYWNRSDWKICLSKLFDRFHRHESIPVNTSIHGPLAIILAREASLGIEVFQDKF